MWAIQAVLVGAIFAGAVDRISPLTIGTLSMVLRVISATRKMGRSDRFGK